MSCAATGRARATMSSAASSTATPRAASSIRDGLAICLVALPTGALSMRPLRSFVAIVAGLAALGAIGDAASAQQAPPKFKDFPAGGTFEGKPARPRLATKDQRDRRELYASAVANGVTFAGHYAVVKYGCGSSCVSSDILDLRSGNVVAVPFTVSGWREIHDDFEPIEAKRDSRLIVFLGAINE